MILLAYRQLFTFCRFGQTVRHEMERQDAVIRAMNECISQDIFKDVLERYKEEIKKLLSRK